MGHPDRLPSEGYIHQHGMELMAGFSNEVLSRKVNIVIGTTSAGAGHWRQADMMVRFLDSVGVNDQITFIATDKTGKKAKSLTDLVLQLYPKLQNKRKVLDLLQPILNSSLAGKFIDKQLEKMIEEGSEDIKNVLEGSPNFDAKRPTIFMSSHSLMTQGARGVMKERKNIDDWMIEFIPDPWKGSDLRGMASPKVDNEHWITVVHDKKTVEEYRKIRPDSKALVVPLGTLSNAVFLERRRLIENGETAERLKEDVLIEFSGNQIPKYDSLIATFITDNAQAIAEGRIRLVIDPMHHKKTYDVLLNALKNVGLDENENILLLKPEKGMGEAVVRRADVLESKSNEVKIKFSDSFRPFAVISKGGEVPLEDRADMIAFCPFASVPHEVGDILAGVSEGRAVDARNIPPSRWLLELDELYKQDREKLPIQSFALFAPALIYIANNPGLLENTQAFETNQNELVQI